MTFRLLSLWLIVRAGATSSRLLVKCCPLFADRRPSADHEQVRALSLLCRLCQSTEIFEMYHLTLDEEQGRRAIRKTNILAFFTDMSYARLLSFSASTKTSDTGCCR